ncbi:hypothetical protein B1L04_15195 [Microcystis aeruginosa KW]|uniref:Uncharacterized protein n=1 Tax=Microcystis aeruginosa KW TaxID=1960155 RepID=A0A1V4BS91_MICAE|nr:hypothetical protein B1L04_15195 [Microcystis aeruginosa KW]
MELSFLNLKFGFIRPLTPIFVIFVLLILTSLYQNSYNGMTKCEISKKVNKYDDFKFESGGEGSWQMVILFMFLCNENTS